MSVANPTRDDFASLLEESFSDGHSGEGQVVKGIITAIEKDMAIIDVGLKVEGRVPMKEFGAKAKDGQMKVGDTVEVYVERIENALGEAMLSREKARREEGGVRLGGKVRKGGGRRAVGGSRRNSTRASGSKASSSTRSRAASRSISTAPWRFCRAAR